ncbi:pancreatic triacylglycerol lipase-like isoform X1 [Ostrinia nubilalis]|uniref:pancreatic triacylglycerol lipase-like isoform X1 n=2 Tax=Ostrinia nubilalis TaxID=29057 RepID=UPI0030825403
MMKYFLQLCYCLLLSACAALAAPGIFDDLGRGLQKEVAAAKNPVYNTLAFIGSSQCSHVKKLAGVAYEQIEGEKEPDLDQLTLKYVSHAINVSFNINTLKDIPLAQDEKLVIFLHGFMDDPGSNTFKTVSEAFYKKGKHNVLALDASPLIHWLYLRASTYVRFIGEKLGAMLAQMAEAGYDPSNFYIVGHSLGSHIAGFTGKQFTGLTGSRVGRITGLDPAGPCFSHVDDDVRLNSTDAEFVDVIHTDAGVFGLKQPIGQVDYYPNSGSLQPNCLWETCSHSRAWRLFAESVLNEAAFPAVKCESWEAFSKKRCSNEVSYMGFPSQPGTTGLYYLQTGEVSPYGLGMNGTVYVNNEGIVRNILKG